MNASVNHLTCVDPQLGQYIAQIGPLPPRQYDESEPYQALIFSVSHQQVHAKAADAILGRFKAACGGAIPSPDKLLKLSVADLRSYGFSTSKAAALHDIAAKSLDGTIPTHTQAQTISDEELVKRLTTTRGVGRWTVEMLLIFALERSDVFPVDDFGVREGYRLIHHLPEQPKPKAFREIGRAYSPHSTLASLYFWHAATAAKAKPTETKKKPPAKG